MLPLEKKKMLLMEMNSKHLVKMILNGIKNCKIFFDKLFFIFVEAAFAAAEARLRPILMTVLTMIFGMIPLVFATGAGANGNRTIGIGVIGGMTLGTLAILFTVPLFFIIFEYLQERIRPVMVEEADQQFLKERERSQREKEKAVESEAAK